MLQKFYGELEKHNGKDYEPQCLRVMSAAIQRYLTEKGYEKNILKDSEFRISRSVLEGKARILRQEGKGKVPNRSRSLTEDEENILWEYGQLGLSTPRSLVQTVWYNNCLHFGMRGREEHYNLKIEHFHIEFDNAGRKNVRYTEGLTKTRNAGLNFKPRIIEPKMYATGGERCPVKMFEEFKKTPTRPSTGNWSTVSRRH